MTRAEKAAKYILDRMHKELDDHFHYHNVQHVLDVLNAAEQIGIEEKISHQDMELLKIAVLFHDAGFMMNQENHESISCEVARNYLPGVGYNDEEINIICDLIMATTVPQQPRTLLEKIICDADLDYLGRDDFFIIGNKMFREFKERGVISSEREWNKMQVKFLSEHKYFTNTSKQLRNEKKAEHINKIKELLNQTA